MDRMVTIQVDTNDGDYETKNTPITIEQVELIRPIVEAIKAFQPYQGEWSPGSFTTHRHNFPVGEQYRPDMGEKSPEEIYGELPNWEFFKTLLPDPEYGFHTIDTVIIGIERIL